MNAVLVGRASTMNAALVGPAAWSERSPFVHWNFQHAKTMKRASVTIVSTVIEIIGNGISSGSTGQHWQHWQQQHRPVCILALACHSSMPVPLVWAGSWLSAQMARPTLGKGVPTLDCATVVVPWPGSGAPV